MLPTELTFGVEIECYSPTNGATLAGQISAGGVRTVYFPRPEHSTSANWKIVPDGSLRDGSAPGAAYGCEAVSPILTGTAGLANLTKVADLIRAHGCKITRDCGIHVHVGARNASIHQLRMIAKLFIKYEAQFDALVPASRRETSASIYDARICRFAKSNKARFSNQADAFAQIDRARTTAQIAEVMNGGYSSNQYTEYRYWKLNFQSMATHGTVEFRQHSGSVESEKICAWVKLVTGFVAAAMSVRDVADAPGEFNALLRKVDRQTAAYLESRRAALQ